MNTKQNQRRFGLHCDLDIEETIKFSHKTLQLMMMLCTIHLNLVAKRSAVQCILQKQLNIYHMNPHCDLELEDSKQIFLHDTLIHDDASPYQVWLQKVQHFRRYYPDEHSLEFFTCCHDMKKNFTQMVKFYTIKYLFNDCWRKC